MKKLKWLLVAVVVGLAAYGVVKDLIEINNMDPKSVTYNGWLSVDGNRLINQRKEEVQFTGVSSHGIQWFGELYNKENLEQLKALGVNIFRVAMYVNPDDDGYVKNRELKDKVMELVDICVELDMYVIVDWHILNDNNPTKYQTEAKEFFSDISAKYKDTPNVIYEICNEPNGDVEWERDVKGYAEDVIGAIRANSPKSLVIVGTPRWSREMVAVANSPLNIENVVYAVHFYAGSDNVTLRDKIDNFRDQGFAVFVSECGMTDATGAGELHPDAFKRWAEYLADRKISWVYWSFTNKDEGSAMLKSDYKVGDEIEESLSESGKAVKEFWTPRQ